ncbi:MAG: hypothetical protein JWR38_984 [Mucilaginibacter sp.]|nr:hypothetical protein [Mucilaginibacter sp.]
MKPKAIILLLLIYLMPFNGVKAQVAKVQQGLLLKGGTATRLENVDILNKRSRITIKSNTIGVFSITALPGDTLQFEIANYLTTNFIVTDFADKIVYMQPVIELAEVVIKENSLIKDLRETQLGYRKKSVFYTGTPHYYYLVLKPMTFIYENFKSEVKQARRFNRFAKRELTTYEITKRFNDSLIKGVIPIKADEIDDFRVDYAPTLKQLNAMNDYDLINYIKNSYEDYKKKSEGSKPLHKL